MNDSSRDSGTGGLVTEQVKQQAQQTAQQAVEGTQQVAGQAVDRATSMLDGRKNQGADTLQQTADALRQTGQTLRDNDGGFVAGLVEASADQVENAAEYLRSHSVNDLVGEVETYARQNSTVFVGGAFVLGLLAARFLKSSSPSSGGGNQIPGRGGYQAYGGQNYRGTNQGSQYSGGRYGGGQYDYSAGQYGSGQYSGGNPSTRYEDVSGTPSVVRDYSPGLMGAQAPGRGETDSSGTGPAVDRDVM
jgi:hypothetical protein